MEFMRRQGIPVLEYEGYQAQVQGSGVDHTIFLASSGSSTREVPCTEMTDDAEFTDVFIDESGGKNEHGKIAYSGNCGNIQSKRVQCFQSWDGGSTHLAKLIGSRQDTRTVLVKNLDFVVQTCARHV